MEPSKHTTEYVEKFKQLKLSDSTRAQMAKNLGAYADFHAATESVRVQEEDRLIKQVSVWYTAILTRYKQFTMPMLAIAAVLLIGGGTSLAAQASVPGDVLYPVKVGVNENVRSIIALSAEAEARLQADLLEERVAEAEALRAAGRLSGALAQTVEAKVAKHVAAADAAADEAEASIAVKTDQRVLVSLLNFNKVVDADSRIDVSSRLNSRVAIGARTGVASQTMATEMAATKADSGMGLMMAAEPAQANSSLQDVEVRLATLSETLARYDVLPPEVKAEYEVILKEAAMLLANARLQTDVEARQAVAVALDVASKVEAGLAAAGIDLQTGAIVDVDVNHGAIIDDGSEPMPVPLPMPAEIRGSSGAGGGVDAVIDPMFDRAVQDVGVDIDGSVEAMTGLSL